LVLGDKLEKVIPPLFCNLHLVHHVENSIICGCCVCGV